MKNLFLTSAIFLIVFSFLTGCESSSSQSEDVRLDNIMETPSNNDGNMTQPNSTSDQTSSENRKANDEELIKLIGNLRSKDLNNEKIINSLQNDGYNLSDIASAMDTEKERKDIQDQKIGNELLERLNELKQKWDNEANSGGGD